MIDVSYIDVSREDILFTESVPDACVLLPSIGDTVARKINGESSTFSVSSRNFCYMGNRLQGVFIGLKRKGVS